MLTALCDRFEKKPTKTKPITTKSGQKKCEI
jgi:hypothetical protein